MQRIAISACILQDLATQLSALCCSPIVAGAMPARELLQEGHKGNEHDDKKTKTARK
jgi:hypothetical protein